MYEDEHILAFNDIYPKARVHVLVVPKLHLASLAELTIVHKGMIGDLMLQLPHIAKSQGLDNGFRTVFNTGAGGGQEIFHLHAHILGG